MPERITTRSRLEDDVIVPAFIPCLLGHHNSPSFFEEAFPDTLPPQRFPEASFGKQEVAVAAPVPNGR